MKKRLILAFAFVLPLLVPPPSFAQANLKGDVATARAKYPTPMSAAQQAAVVNEVAWKHRAEGWGLLSKPSGNHCPQPATGTPVSCDFLVFKVGSNLVGFDVLVGAEDAGIPTWDGPQSGLDPGRFVAPVEPVDGGRGPVDPPPPPPNTDVIRAIVALETRLDQIDDQLNAIAREIANQPDTRAALAAIKAEIEALRSRPLDFPVYKGRVLGQPFTLSPQR